MIYIYIYIIPPGDSRFVSFGILLGAVGCFTKSRFCRSIAVLSIYIPSVESSRDTGRVSMKFGSSLFRFALRAILSTALIHALGLESFMGGPEHFRVMRKPVWSEPKVSMSRGSHAMSGWRRKRHL